MNKFLGPQELIAQVPIKIAFQIAKRVYSLTGAEDFLEFVRAADPNSEVLQKAVGRSEFFSHIFSHRKFL